MRRLIDKLNTIDWSKDAPDWLSIPAIIFFIVVLSKWLDVLYVVQG